MPKSELEVNSEELFYRALEIDSAERESFVNSHCNGNEGLRKEVLQLLRNQASDSTGGFILDREPGWFKPNVREVANLGEQPGDQIGSYRLLEKIGEGGMGVVYMAEQTIGLQRKVALKIVKLGMDTRQVIARFEAERQAMALFEHSGIARVLDSGATDHGRPYFVMELVKGFNIVDFVRQRRLNLVAKLELFIEVCKAVHHAHQKGIIHRDLKPSNILVTMIDGEAVPKIIDFGVVKAVGHRLTDKTVFTRYSAMIGTPQYMSPEQAELSGADVDTRSDIYSLGIVLYELIVGAPPLNRERIKDLNPLALFETLRDAHYPTPSAQITRLDPEQHGKTGGKGWEPSASGELLEKPRNELDWIVMKAISADRGQRYETVSEFANDLRRYLEGDPVLAAPPSRTYQLRSYLRKHRAFISSVAVVSCLLVTATIISTFLAFRSDRLNRELTDALVLAKTNLQRAENAEKELRKAKLDQDYEAVFTIAMSKFSAIVWQEYAKVFEGISPPMMEPELVEMDPEQAIGDPVIAIVSDLSFDFEYQGLTQFPDLKEFELPSSRLNQFLLGNESINQELNAFHESLIANESPIDAQELSEIEFESQEPSEQSLELQKRLRASAPKLKVQFYHLLVRESRKTFGENDPKICDALTLLAAALIEAKEFSEARAHLREAIALLGKSGSKLQYDLLQHIDQQTHPKRQSGH